MTNNMTSTPGVSHEKRNLALTLNVALTSAWRVKRDLEEALKADRKATQALDNFLQADKQGFWARSTQLLHSLMCELASSTSHP